MKLTSIVESLILPLSAPPKTDIQWSILNDSSLEEKAIHGTKKDEISFNVQDLEDDKAYTFEFLRTDANMHSFFVKKFE